MRACQLSSPQSPATVAHRDSWQLAGESSPAPLVASQGKQDRRTNQQAANYHPFERSIPVLAPWDIRSEKGTLRGIYWPHSACRREAEKVESESIHVFQTLVPFILFAKEKPVFPVLIPIRQRIALCFHALYGGIVRWMKPRSTSLLFGTIADLAKGKSELLVENALLRQQLIILHRQVKRPACKKTDTFLLVLLARMIRTWKQALFIVQPETLLRLPSGTLPLVLEAHVKG